MNEREQGEMWGAPSALGRSKRVVEPCKIEVVAVAKVQRP